MSQKSLKSFRAYAQRLIEQGDPFDLEYLEITLADMQKASKREYRDNGMTRAWFAMQARINIIRNAINTLYPAEPITAVKYAFVNESEPDEYIHLGEGDEEDIDLDEP